VDFKGAGKIDNEHTMMNPRCLTVGFILLTLLMSGCITPSKPETVVVEGVPPTATTTSTVIEPTTTASTITTTTTAVQTQAECIQPPGEGCECVEWSCQRTTSSTTTTCVTLPYPEYAPQAKYFTFTIKGDKFKPSSISVFEGDLVIANITNKQGLHRIRETYSNKTIVLPPGESHELIFYAADEGEYLLTCNPYCEEPMEAKVIVSKPYKIVC
jgi:plastocyanin